MALSNPREELKNPPAASEQIVNQELHRRRVSKLILSLVMRLDGFVAKMIGFNGSILEEIYKKKGSLVETDESINIEGIDSSLRRYLDPDGFSYRRDSISYGIGCYGYFHFNVELPVNNGYLNLTIATKQASTDFNNITFTRYSLSPDGSTSYIKQVMMFVPSIKEGQPNYPMVISVQNGKLQRRIFVSYGNIDANGGVELQEVEIIPDPLAPHIKGIYSEEEQKIRWQSPSATTGIQSAIINGQLDLNLTDEKLLFPLKTNIYAELRDIMSGGVQLKT